MSHSLPQALPEHLGAGAARGWPGEALVAAGVGFLGSCTTFSTWMYETIALAQRGALAGAVLGMVIGSALSDGASGESYWFRLMKRRDRVSWNPKRGVSGMSTRVSSAAEPAV